jgi:hypothetical protein
VYAIQLQIQPNIKLKTWSEQLLGFILFAFEFSVKRDREKSGLKAVYKQSPAYSGTAPSHSLDIPSHSAPQIQTDGLERVLLFNQSNRRRHFL